MSQDTGAGRPVSPAIDGATANKDRTLLIVDDDEPNRYTLARRLTRDGFANLGMASNGVEALASLRQDKFDLVLLDRQGCGQVDARLGRLQALQNR